jgi:transposase
LTSPDPQYKQKIAKVLETIRGLNENEVFFFIDEAGPYSVKKYGGVALSPPNETRTLPERQKSKGKIQFAAALEATSNQLTWLFIENKGSSSIVALIELLLLHYNTRSKVYLTWDGISSHNSTVIRDFLKKVNEDAESGKGPFAEIVPLPSKSQFLNVIEAVLSGMKKAVIKNSDYPSKEAMQAAIAEYFEERNQHFQGNPRRAGNKIWDKETFDFSKLAGGLFKRM